MKVLIIVILNCLTLNLVGQGFNSVTKAHSLPQVTIQRQFINRTIKEIDIPVTTVSSDNTAIGDKPDFKVKEMKTTPYPLSSILFSKPMVSLHRTSSFGPRFHPILKKWRFHSGVDFASNADTVYSILSGRIKSSGYSPTLGYYVKTEHYDGKIEVLYAHLSQYHHQERQHVNAGETIGITGSTGLSTGDHLHLAISINNEYVDPIEFMSTILRFNSLRTRL
ncbi:M23 family metallopeptidase [Sphingobacterium siyangense]|uniref:M23 family metallopeptidase n=1 Tax=Sphingobacterium siyangense TaxID=459529 RepID=UPI00289C5AB3|nr:M23 family metallopeptidase [Sphingobacterium siyangense]